MSRRPCQPIGDQIPASRGQGNECPICYLPFNVREDENGNEVKNDTVYQNPVCGHIFHTQCIVQWFVRGANPNCPVCRRRLEFTQEELGGQQRGQGADDDDYDPDGLLNFDVNDVIRRRAQEVRERQEIVPGRDLDVPPGYFERRQRRRLEGRPGRRAPPVYRNIPPPVDIEFPED